MGEEEKRREDRYLNNYYKCRNATGVTCNISWEAYPSLFERNKKAVVIPENYKHLGLPQKFYSSRCKRCQVANSIANFKTREGSVRRGKSLQELKNELVDLNAMVKEVTLYKKPEKEEEEEKEEEGSNHNEDSDEDSLIDENGILRKEIEGLKCSIRDREDTLREIYSTLFNVKVRLAKKQATCRKSVCVKTSDYYNIKEEIEEMFEDEELVYDKKLDEHMIVKNPDSWTDDCSSNGSKK
jgi:hypothetical protein